MNNNNSFKRVILASQSPRRVELLTQMGIDCIVMPADIDEVVLVDESPTEYVLRLAVQKALVTQEKMQNRHLPIVAADTIVALGRDILGKPDNDADAFNMLKKLSGSSHHVHTAVAVAWNGKLEKSLNTTLVQMMPLTDAMIAAYIASGEPRDKAGSYAIQGLAGSWISRIEGSYTGVMGLPVHETALLLSEISKD